MKDRTRIDHFIPCTCHRGGLMVNGIEVEDHEGFITISHVHVHGIAWAGGFWQRVKNAWACLRGKTIMGDDSVLGRDGVEGLRDVCQNALDRWPELDDIEDNGTLEELYQQMEYLEVGRKLREKRDVIKLATLTGSQERSKESFDRAKSSDRIIGIEYDPEPGGPFKVKKITLNKGASDRLVTKADVKI